MKQYYTAKEVAGMMGVCESVAYKIIRQLNGQLKDMGYITIQGKVNRKYFEEKCCYDGKKGA